jgi:hypothetical protein
VRLAVLMTPVSLYYHFRIDIQVYRREHDAEPADLLEAP